MGQEPWKIVRGERIVYALTPRPKGGMAEPGFVILIYLVLSDKHDHLTRCPFKDRCSSGN